MDNISAQKQASADSMDVEQRRSSVSSLLAQILILLWQYKSLDGLYRS